MNVDHCHTTGRVRALLCSPCNVIVGKAEANADFIQKLTEYVDRATAIKFNGLESMTLPQHLSTSVELYTPDYIVEAARATLGSIDLDPASCAIGNEVVKATRYFDRDGLTQPWSGRLLLNPPGGRAEIPGMGTNSNACLWWRVLAAAYEVGHITSAIFVGFTLEILSTAQGMPGLQPIDFPRCYSKGRTCFDLPRLAEIERLKGEIQKLGGTIGPKDKKRDALIKRLAEVEATHGNRVRSESPTHANVFVFLPAERGLGQRYEVERFKENFASIGRVCVPS